jgi:hypothetical protein
VTEPALQPTPRTFPFDVRPLTERADPAAVRRFHSELKRRFPASATSTVAIILVALIALPVLGIGITVFGTLLTAFVERGLGLLAAPVVLSALAVVALLVWLLVRRLGGLSRERKYRLDGFARANGMSYLPTLRDPQLPGMIFRRGSSRTARDILRGEQPRFVEFANYEYTTGSGKNQTTHRWGYVAIHLGTPLPHIVLDAVGNNSVFGSNLPAQFSRAQRLSLEGDFDRYFTLYCPEGYERDALYLFTPDVMARFIDNVAQLDVEIVDDWLFLYAGRPVSTTNPDTWAWLFSAVSGLMDKLSQWQRWRDERLAVPAVAEPGPLPFQSVGAGAAAAPPPPAAWTGPKGVAPSGRRLKGGVPWIAVVAILIGFAVLAAPTALGALGLLLWR